MRLAEVRIEGAERNMILRFCEGSDAVQVQVCSQDWTELQPEVTVVIANEDAAWDAATNAHLVCEGYEGSGGDVQPYHTLFCTALQR